MTDTTIKTAPPDTTGSVLHIPIVSQMQSPLIILRELREFLEPKSQDILDFLHMKGLIKEVGRTVTHFELLELEENIPFVEIPEILSQKELESPSIESILDMLYTLKSKRNIKTRKNFFKDGLVLLSLEPILIDGKVQYIAIAENPCLPQSEEQWIYSLRLISLPKIFACKFYRLITVKRYV